MSVDHPDKEEPGRLLEQAPGVVSTPMKEFENMSTLHQGSLRWAVVPNGTIDQAEGLARAAGVSVLGRPAPVVLTADDGGFPLADVGTLHTGCCGRAGHRVEIAHGVTPGVYRMVILRAVQLFTANESGCGDGLLVRVEPDELEPFLDAAAGQPWTVERLIELNDQRRAAVSPGISAGVSL